MSLTVDPTFPVHCFGHSATSAAATFVFASVPIASNLFPHCRSSEAFHSYFSYLLLHPSSPCDQPLDCDLWKCASRCRRLSVLGTRLRTFPHREVPIETPFGPHICTVVPSLLTQNVFAAPPFFFSLHYFDMFSNVLLCARVSVSRSSRQTSRNPTCPSCS